MSEKNERNPSEIMRSTLEAIDHLRIALDCAVERRDENATKLLKKLISETFAVVHAIEDDEKKH